MGTIYPPPPSTPLPTRLTLWKRVQHLQNIFPPAERTSEAEGVVTPQRRQVKGGTGGPSLSNDGGLTPSKTGSGTSRSGGEAVPHRYIYIYLRGKAILFLTLTLSSVVRVHTFWIC